MTQENKELLLKDLCARLPYGVKIEHTDSCIIGTLNNLTTYRLYDGDNIKDIYSAIDIFGDGNCIRVEYFRPYLFPLSSMTEELKNFIRWKLTTPKYDSFDEESLEDLFNNNMQVVQFCYEHHLDINGLIEKRLALDATGLNIY